MTIEEFLDRHDAAHSAPMNVIDLDMGHRDVPLLELPDCIQESSLVHSLARSWAIPREMDPRRGISSYLLLSEENCLTDFHQDFSGTSVFYYVLKVCLPLIYKLFGFIYYLNKFMNYWIHLLSKSLSFIGRGRRHSTSFGPR
jgi:hypothetical protein